MVALGCSAAHGVRRTSVLRIPLSVVVGMLGRNRDATRRSRLRDREDRARAAERRVRERVSDRDDREDPACASCILRAAGSGRDRREGCDAGAGLHVARRFRVPERQRSSTSSLWLGCCSLTIMFSNYSAGASFDELVDATGQPRDGVQRVVSCSLGSASTAALAPGRCRSDDSRAGHHVHRLRAEQQHRSRMAVRHHPAGHRQREWDGIARGLEQRLRALNLFIDDLYNEQRVVQAGVFPGELLGELQELPRGLSRRAAQVRRLGAYLRHGSGA